LKSYQKLKKSLTSFSVVWLAIPSTWTVLDMIIVRFEYEKAVD
jgi:hypothetical protein